MKILIISLPDIRKINYQRPHHIINHIAKHHDVSIISCNAWGLDNLIDQRTIDLLKNVQFRYITLKKVRQLVQELVIVKEIPKLRKESYDVIISFHSFIAGPILSIGLRRPLVIDICDDVNPTIEALQLNQFAINSGIFVLVGMGWFPGMSNLRGKWLADKMDSVEEIVIAWVAGKKAPEDKPSKGLAGIEHYLEALTGEIYSFRQGHRIKIPVNRNGVSLTFPEPLGKYLCYQIIPLDCT